jgi:inner membrane protein
MDNLTHSLAGLVLARAGLGRGGPGTTLALVISSNLPDADVVTWAHGTAAYLEHHRGLSHGVVGAPFLALALAIALRLCVRGSRFATLLLCALAGVAGHVFMDLWTTYGTRVLSPFDATWYAWDIVFILDPFVWALLGGALFVESVLRARQSPMSAPAAAVGLGLLLTYVGARAILHARAVDEARHVLPREGVLQTAAIPSPLDPFRWKLLADAGTSFYSGEIDLRKGPRPLRRRDKRPEDARVARVRQTSEAAGIFLAFSRFPWLEVDESADGVTVSWRDLRFEDVPGLVSRERAEQARQRFVARVVLGPDGQIRSETIRF